MELESIAVDEVVVESEYMLDAGEAMSASRRGAGRSLCCL
jgi:hypothetical protein